MSRKLFYIAIILVLVGSSLCSEIIAVEKNSVKFLVSITFKDGSSCIGALISSLKIATSLICLEKFRFASRIQKKPCKVFAGIQPNPDKDVRIWRFCVGRPIVLDYFEEESRLLEFEFHYENTPMYIEIDLPFDKHVVTMAKIGKPYLKKNESCTVYGYGKLDDAKKQAGNANEQKPLGGRRRKRQTDDGNTLLSRKANILALDNCKRLYREYMDDVLPENQFCVAEGGISDLGRILVCIEKVVGAVVNDVAIFQKNGSSIYAYTAINKGSYHMKFLVSEWIEIMMCLMMLWSWSKMYS